MDIVLICHADEQVDTHLKRFLWLAKKHIPKANYHLLVPVKSLQHKPDMDRVRPYVARITWVEEVKEIMAAGRLLYYDWLRARALDIFYDLDEVLYMDIDTDILRDISHIPSLSKDDVMCAPNIAHPRDVVHAMSVFGLDSNLPFAEEAVMYMRRSFAKEFDAVMNSGKFPLNTYVPGMAIWNVVIRQHGSYHQLPYAYNTMWNQNAVLKDAYIVHYGGDWGKSVRMYQDWSTWPEQVRTNLKEPIKMDLW